MASKADTAKLISSVNRRLTGSSLPKRRDTGRLKNFTAPSVRKFIDSNTQSVQSAKRLGQRGFDRLAARYIRENK